MASRRPIPRRRLARIADRPLFPAVHEDELSYDAGSRILSKVDRRLGAYLPRRDRRYTYDDLHRLVEEQPGLQADDAWVAGWNHDGTGAGAGWTAAGIDPNDWDLDPLGNWEAWNIDYGFDGAVVDADAVSPTAHNAANELLMYRFESGGDVITNPLAYDAAGNLLGSPLGTPAYTYDAWNRLVGYSSDPLSSSGESSAYNALHHRIAREDHRPAPLGGEQRDRRLVYWSPSWQMLEEHVDADYDSGVGFSADRIAQQVWGPRYIDDAVLRRVDYHPSDGVFNNYDAVWYVTDHQFSVVAMLGKAGPVLGRTAYDAYGNERSFRPDDWDQDGDVDGDDFDAFYAAWSAQAPAADLDRDGVVDGSDLAAYLAIVPPSPAFESPVGYAGYLRSGRSGLWAVRFRHLDSRTGRWQQRDPAGYVDGGNRYAYTMGRPVSFMDPLGLWTAGCEDGSIRRNLYSLSWADSKTLPAGPFLYGSFSISIDVEFEGGQCDICCPDGSSGRRNAVTATGSGKASLSLTGGYAFEYDLGKLKVDGYIGGRVEGSAQIAGLRGGAVWDDCEENANPELLICSGGALGIEGTLGARVNASVGPFSYSYGAEAFIRGEIDFSFCFVVDLQTGSIRDGELNLGALQAAMGWRLCNGGCREIIVWQVGGGGVGSP